jgi:hypothetical protein
MGIVFQKHGQCGHSPAEFRSEGRLQPGQRRFEGEPTSSEDRLQASGCSLLCEWGLGVRGKRGSKLRQEWTTLGKLSLKGGENPGGECHRADHS